MDPSLRNVTWCNSKFLYCRLRCCIRRISRLRDLVLRFESSQLFALVAARDDEGIRALVVTRLVSTRRLAPWSYRMTSAGSLAFATTVRVVDRVHGDTAVRRIDALPAIASGLADGDVLVVGVANLADGRHAFDKHLARLARGQLEQRVVAFLRDQIDLRTGRTRHLSALARAQLDVVHDRSKRNVLQR